MTGNWWMCPACGRFFGRTGQSHLCVPARQLDDFLATQPDAHRAIFEAVVAHVGALEDAIIEPGDSYLMLKRRRKFAALTPRRRWVRMWFILPEAIDDDRIMSRTRSSARAGVAHFLQLTSAEDVDETIRGWLTESYEACLPDRQAVAQRQEAASFSRRRTPSSRRSSGMVRERRT